MQIATKRLHRARAMVRNDAGWLLTPGDGHCLAANNEDAVRHLRGPAFVAQSALTQQCADTQVKVK